jgi:hypothetical protein
VPPDRNSAVTPIFFLARIFDLALANRGVRLEIRRSHHARASKIFGRSSRFASRARPDRLPRFRLWWETLCSQHGLDARDARCRDFARHVAGLVRNGIEAGDRVLVGAAVTRRDLAATIQDDGPGFSNALERRRLSRGQGLGYEEAIEFADELKIESRGRLNWKTPLGMREAEVPLSRPGTRIFLRKSLSSSRGGH